MGKKQKGKQKNQTYFNLQFQQLGEGWMGKITTQDVRKSALRLFKDIASANLDLPKDIQFFNEPSFTYNLKLAADDNAYYNWTIYNSLYNMQYRSQVDEDIMQEHFVRYNAFLVLSECLNNILNGLYINGGIQTEFLITDMITKMQPFKYSFNGYYITINRKDDGKLKTERRQRGNDSRNGKRLQGPVKGFPNPSDM